MAFITVAAATIQSIPLDFKSNGEAIKESIRLARLAGAKLRTGYNDNTTGSAPCTDLFYSPELEICGQLSQTVRSALLGALNPSRLCCVGPSPVESAVYLAPIDILTCLTARETQQGILGKSLPR